jgi:glycosyltransferase involved in cell wall biosynthesis
MPYIFSRVPKTAHNITKEISINNYAFATDLVSLSSLPVLIKSTKYRLVITLNVGDNGNGISMHEFRQLESILNISIPQLPINSLLSQNGEQRKLAVTIDSIDKPSVAILIPHWNSWMFLKPCLEYIQKNRNPEIEEKVYVLDDESTDGSYEKAKEHFKDDPLIQFFQFSRPNKKYSADIGLLLDYGLQLVNEQYTAMIDADVFPLSKDWLSFPIWLINRYNCSAVGLDTGLSTSYRKQANFSLWQPKNGYIPTAGLYDNTWYVHINNLYRIMPSATAKVCSEQIGFTRNDHFDTFFKKALNRIGRWYFFWLPYHKRWPYFPGGEDNGVAANHFIDINKLGPKFNLPITSYLGLTPHDGVFGQNICGLIFHFALSTRALSTERREVSNAGKEFNFWVNRLQNEGMSDKLLSEMIKESNAVDCAKMKHWTTKYSQDNLAYIKHLIDLSKK